VPTGNDDAIDNEGITEGATLLKGVTVGCVAQWKNVGYSPANFPVLRLICS